MSARRQGREPAPRPVEVPPARGTGACDLMGGYAIVKEHFRLDDLSWGSSRPGLLPPAKVARAGVEPASFTAPGFEPGVVTTFHHRAEKNVGPGLPKLEIDCEGGVLSWRTSGLYRSIATKIRIAFE